VIAGSLELADITSSYEGLRRAHGVTMVKDRATRIDAQAKIVTLAGGRSIRYDKLVLSPGIEPISGAVEGLDDARAQGQILQSWVAGAETVALHRQLLAMHDGGVFAITIPESPYRCPPAPYERASLVAAYLKIYKPRSKVLVLDANQDVTAMAPLFKRAWTELYGDILEYRNHYKVTAVDGKSHTARFELQEDERADVLNVLPPLRAGALAVQSGLANVNARWCEVDFLSFASALAKDIHVLGDSIQAAPMMPKSGHMANAQAKVAAAAIVAELQDIEIDPSPMLTNTCYSFVSASEAIHSTAVYAYAADARTFRVVSGASGVSAAPSELEAAVAMAWAHGIWADILS
jgi:NADPH-dependent 2,4-dienoyl-CoA reductase/sulfur reductase-like enzyme